MHNLAIFLKIGSSGVVKLYQKWIFFRNWALVRPFFFGFAKQKPNVLGGRNILGSRWLRLFWFLAAMGGFLFGRMELDTSFEKAIFVGFNGRLVQSSLF